MTEKESALSRALHYLSWRSRTRNEVIQHLRQKEYTETEITDALHRLADYGYVNDDAYMKQVTESILAHPGKGKNSIKGKVRHKGIDEELVHQHIENYDNEVDEEKARLLAQKLVKQSQNLPWRKIQEKINRQLMSKGFDQEVIQRTLRGVEENTEIQQLFEERFDARKEKAIADAQKLYHKWMHKEKDRQIIRSKIMQSLYQKGYTTELIHQVTASVMKDDE